MPAERGSGRVFKLLERVLLHVRLVPRAVRVGRRAAGRRSVLIRGRGSPGELVNTTESFGQCQTPRGMLQGWACQELVPITSNVFEDVLLVGLAFVLLLLLWAALAYSLRQWRRRSYDGEAGLGEYREIPPASVSPPPSLHRYARPHPRAATPPTRTRTRIRTMTS